MSLELLSLEQLGKNATALGVRYLQLRAAAERPGACPEQAFRDARMADEHRRAMERVQAEIRRRFPETDDTPF